jgi:capsular polysaccharide biosynthesis protein
MVHRDDGFHPIADDLLGDLLNELGPLERPHAAPRLFLVRGESLHTGGRRCTNEAALVELARTKHGFTPVAMETLPWRSQLALLRHAEIVLGLFGSALHGALFCLPGTRVACVGLGNMVQSEIGALRGHVMAYMTEGFEVKDTYSVSLADFERFLDAVCAPAVPV